MNTGLINIRQLTPAQVRRLLPAIDGITPTVAESYAKRVEAEGHAADTASFVDYLKGQGVSNRYLIDIAALVDFQNPTPADAGLGAAGFSPTLALLDPGLAVVSSPALGLLAGATPAFFGVDETLTRINDLLKDPRQLVTGPTATGKREPTVVAVGERCTEPLDEHCPLKQALVVYRVQHFKDDNLSANVRIRWAYDCCNIYNVAAELDISDRPASDELVFMLQRFSIPEVEPVKLEVCTPCQPKCLNVKLTIYHLESDKATAPGIKAIYNIDVDLCANKKGKPKIADNTVMIKAGDVRVERISGPKTVEAEVVTGN